MLLFGDSASAGQRLNRSADDSARRRRRNFLRECAAHAGAFPGFNFPGLIHFGEVENRPTGRTVPDKSSAFIELSIDPVQITGGVAEYPRAISAPAAVIRPNLFGIFLQHHPPHRGVVYIAQRRELLPGRHEGLLTTHCLRLSSWPCAAFLQDFPDAPLAHRDAFFVRTAKPVPLNDCAIVLRTGRRFGHADLGQSRPGCEKRMKPPAFDATPGSARRSNEPCPIGSSPGSRLVCVRNEDGSPSL